MTDREQPLKVELEGGLLTISIGAAALLMALKAGPAFDTDGEEEAEITDEDAFLRAFVDAVEDEEEDGSNRILCMFDAAAQDAIELGAEGVRFPGDD